MKAADITGQRFGKLVALSFYDYTASKSHSRWSVRCDCGAVYPTYKSHLMTGKIKQCVTCGHDKRAQDITTHSRSRTSEYMSFHAAKNRCENPNDKRYTDYGGRGIKFMLNSIDDLIGDIGPRPAGRSIDRIDNDGHYEKGNLKWSTAEEQADNRRPRRYSDECREID